MRSALVGCLLALTGCASRTVHVEIPALPAVELAADTVSIVSTDKGCKPTADALAARLALAPGIQVDPRSGVRLRLDECGTSYESVVFVNDLPDNEMGETRRLTLEGRAFAMVEVEVEGQHQATLVGSSRQGSFQHQERVGLWDLLALRRNVDRRLSQALVEDLVRQISPFPTLAQRRVYSNPSPGTARELHNRAVMAEQHGDLDEAWRLAQLAYDAHPRGRIAAYRAALEFRRAQPIPPDTAP